MVVAESQFSELNTIIIQALAKTASTAIFFIHKDDLNFLNAAMKGGDDGKFLFNDLFKQIIKQKESGV